MQHFNMPQIVPPSDRCSLCVGIFLANMCTVDMPDRNCKIRLIVERVWRHFCTLSADNALALYTEEYRL